MRREISSHIDKKDRIFSHIGKRRDKIACPAALLLSPKLANPAVMKQMHTFIHIVAMEFLTLSTR